MNQPDSRQHILLVEDEPNFGAVLRDFLEMKGFQVSLAEDGTQGWALYQDGRVDLCVLDVMMPGIDGFTLAKMIRERDEHQALMFLTARQLPEDKIQGFKIGADDYLTKPFHSEELLLRVKAILKRTSGFVKESENSDQSFAGFTFQPSLHVLASSAGEEKLSPKEAELLELLLIRKNSLLSREEALRKLWGEDNYFNARSMDVFISKLRKRFKSNDQVKIENVHGKGFRMLVRE